MSKSVIIDISPEIHSGIGVFPGDVPFSRSESMAFKKGHHLDLSSVTTTLHLGAHADSTSHYSAEGQGIETKNLEVYYGPVQVIRIDVARNSRIRREQIKESIQAERVLFCTGTFPDPDQWNSDFAGFTPEVIDWLSSQGVKLVGIDTPSVDLEQSKDLPAHQALLRNKISVLEGLILSHVKPGLYTLIALPLKIRGGDASPVRAVLIP